MPARVDWYGGRVLSLFERAERRTLTRVGTNVQDEAKIRLYPGHGYDTGTLQRSIHAATPGYDWEGDNVPRSPFTPERGIEDAQPARVAGGALAIQIGSGQDYSLWVELGTAYFLGYHYLEDALAAVEGDIVDILREECAAVGL